MTHEVGTAHTDKEQISKNRTGKGMRIAGTKFSWVGSESKPSTFGNTTGGKLGWEEICESTIHSLESGLLFDNGFRQSFTGAEKMQKNPCVLRLAYSLE